MSAALLAALLVPREWHPSGRTLAALNVETEWARYLSSRRAQRRLN